MRFPGSRSFLTFVPSSDAAELEYFALHAKVPKTCEQHFLLGINGRQPKPLTPYSLDIVVDVKHTDCPELAAIVASYLAEFLTARGETVRMLASFKPRSAPDLRAKRITLECDAQPWGG